VRVEFGGHQQPLIAGGHPGEQGSFATGPCAQIQPGAGVAGGLCGSGQGQRDQLTPLVLDTGAALGDRRDLGGIAGPGGSVGRVETGGGPGVEELGELGQARAYHQGRHRCQIVGLQSLGGLLDAQTLDELCGDPARVTAQQRQIGQLVTGGQLGRPAWQIVSADLA